MYTHNTTMLSYTDLRYININCCGSVPCYSTCSIVTHATASIVHALKVAYGLFPHTVWCRSPPHGYALLLFSVVGPQVSAYTHSTHCVSCLAASLSPAALIPLYLPHSGSRGLDLINR